MGADRLAELCGVAAHAPDQGAARQRFRLVGPDRPCRDHLRISGREHVFVWTPQLWDAVIPA